MDAMVPEADAQEQHTPVVDDEDEHAFDRVSDDPEVPEADALEQSQAVPYDDEERG